MIESDYRAVPDGGLLRMLDSGLEVVRRKKHKWFSDLEGMDSEGFRRNSDKICGSKFLRTRSLEEYVRWIEMQTSALGWDETTTGESATIDLGETVGYSNGAAVTKIRIVLSSRCVHAYPVEA